MRVPCSDGSPAVPEGRAAPRSEVPDAVRTFLRETGFAPAAGPSASCSRRLAAPVRSASERSMCNVL